MSKAQAYVKQGIILQEKIPIKVKPLRKILQEYINNFQKIDFMSVDVEGLDLVVLESNDWNNPKFRPNLVIVESKTFNLEKNHSTAASQLDDFFRKINYSLVFKNQINSIYQEKTF